MGSTTTKPQDFVILGPSLASGNSVLEAIHSLYYLPENYKLIFTGATAVDKDFYNQVITLMRHDGVSDRVQFVEQASASNAVILPHPRKSRAKHSVAGDSPEALASAILNVARATA